MMDQLIIRYLSQNPNVSAGLIFGSMAANRVRPAGDLDLAVLFAPDSVPDDETILGMRAELEQLTQRDVDLIVLNRAPTILAYQILRTGKIVWLRDQAALDRFTVRLISEYADFKITRRPIEEAVIRRRVL